MIRQKTIYEPRPCLNCGTTIQSPKKTQKFCCLSCNATYYAKIKKPEGIIRCKKCMYKGHIISGTFELRAAYILDKMLEKNDIISWEYTNDTIKYISYDNKEHNYLLDFKYIDLNNDIKYIEVKGVKTNIDEYKWKAAEKQGLNLDKWFLDDIELKEKQYNITNDQLEKLFDECIENYKNNKITKICKECGKEFYGKGNTHFCSKECKQKHDSTTHKIDYITLKK